MKKLVNTLAFTGGLVLATHAQQYGEWMYPHPGYFLSTAETVKINSSGYISGTYKPTCTLEEYNFIIDRSDDNGKLTGTSQFSKGYATMGNPNCKSNISQVFDCKGISVIEIRPVRVGGSDAWYAVVGANSAGTFFATLDKNGTPLSSASYRFKSGTPPKQPFLFQSSTKNNEFLICGSNQNDVYALRIDISGSVLWSRSYHSDCSLEINEIVECPFSGNITAVGIADVPNRASDGLFMKIDANSGALNVIKTYGMPPIGHCNEFYAVDVAMSPQGGKGFIIAGMSDPVSPAYQGVSWFVKVDAVGNIIWDHLVQPDQSGARVASVLERNNIATGSFEYYGVAIGSFGATVLKLDEFGKPFGLSGANDQFVYDNPSPYWPDPISILHTPNGAVSPNEGIHVFSRDQLTPNPSNPAPLNTYQVNAYFNGASGCEQFLTQQIGYAPGPADIFLPNPDVMPGPEYCPYFSLVSFNLNTPQNFLCAASSINYGSNARSAANLAGTIKTGSGPEVFPNPVKDKTKLIQPVRKGAVLAVTIYDAMGRLVRSENHTNDSTAPVEIELDFKSAELDAGLYYIQTYDGNETHTIKVVYEK